MVNGNPGKRRTSHTTHLSDYFSSEDVDAGANDDLPGFGILLEKLETVAAELNRQGSIRSSLSEHPAARLLLEKADRVNAIRARLLELQHDWLSLEEEYSASLPADREVQQPETTGIPEQGSLTPEETEPTVLVSSLPETQIADEVEIPAPAEPDLQNQVAFPEVLDIVVQVYNLMQTGRVGYSGAVKKIARDRKLPTPLPIYQTCTRRINLTADQFLKLVHDGNSLAGHLARLFPAYKKGIRKKLGLTGHQ